MTNTSTHTMTGASADAVELLISQHREVEQIWTMLQEAHRTGSGTQAELGRKIVAMLSQHDALETQFLYPELRARGGEEGQRMSEHSLDEHREVRDLLVQVDERDPADDEVFAIFSQCIESVMHHVQEEESRIFPLLRQHVDQPRLMELGRTMDETKKMAPTHPHPHTPDSKLGATVAGAVGGMMDRARDAMRGGS